jgi:uncharacterized protein YciI
MSLRLPRPLAATAVAALMFGAIAPAPAQTYKPARDVRYVIVHTPGPAWIAGKSFFEQPGLQAHVEHYRQLLAQGKLVLGGPFLDGAAGGMMVPAPGLSQKELDDVAQADPAVRSGLLKAEVRPWLIGMKG